jgi:hypothetical protein
MKLRVSAIIDIDEAYYDLEDEEEMKWFKDLMEDKENTSLMVWSNDIGDEVGSTFKFDYEIIKGDK